MNADFIVRLVSERTWCICRSGTRRVLGMEEMTSDEERRCVTGRTGVLVWRGDYLSRVGASRRVDPAERVEVRQ